VYRITVELLPHGDESKAEVVAQGKICNLRRHEPGSPLGTFHAFFEANAVPERDRPAFSADELEPTYHTIGDCVLEDYPRSEGNVWDLVASTLHASGRGWPTMLVKEAV
jgi:hypothetical protein